MAQGLTINQAIQSIMARLDNDITEATAKGDYAAAGEATKKLHTMRLQQRTAKVSGAPQSEQADELRRQAGMDKQYR